jgi:hypothetical protein
MTLKYESPKYAVNKVKLSADEKEKLIKYLCEEHEQVLQARKDHEDKWRTWRKQANSRLERDGTGPRDSNIDIPNTREYMMQNAARLQTPIFQQDQVMVAIPTKPSTAEIALQIERAIEWMLNRVNPRILTDEWIEQFQTFHAGFVKTGFTTEIEFVKEWKEITGSLEVAPEEEYMIMSQTPGITTVKRDLDDGTTKYFYEASSKRERRTGCFPEVVPVEDIIFPLTSADIYSAPWFTHRLWPTKREIEFRMEEDVWESKDAEGDPMIDALEKSERERFTFAVENPEDSSPKSMKQYDIRETYMIWKIKDKNTEIIVTWEPKSKQILSLIENYYHEFHRPFVAHQYKHIQNSIYGIPLTYMIEPLHRAYSASINQRLDQATLANETFVFGPPSMDDLVSKVDGLIHGGYYETNATKDEIWTLNLGNPNFSQMPELEEKLELHMQRIAGLSDYSFGEEQVGRPTATGTMQLVEESKQPQYLQLERFRDALSEVVKHMLSRYKQFYPEGMRLYEANADPMPQKMMDPNQPQQPITAMQEISISWPEGAIEDSVIINTKVSSSTMSKNVRKSEALAMLDKIPQVYQGLAQFAMQAASPNPQAPALPMIALSLLNGYQKIINDFLTIFDVPGKEEINPPLVQEAQVAQQINQQFMQLQQQMQQMAMQNQQLQQQLQYLTGGQPQGGMAQPPNGQPGPQGSMPMGPGA